MISTVNVEKYIRALGIGEGLELERTSNAVVIKYPQRLNGNRYLENYALLLSSLGPLATGNATKVEASFARISVTIVNPQAPELVIPAPKVKGRDYKAQAGEITAVMQSLSLKVNAFAEAHQGTGTYYDELGHILEQLKELDDFFNPTA